MSRVFKTKGAWWIDYKDAKGVRRRQKVAPTKRIAKEILHDTLGKVARRAHLGVLADSPISFEAFIEIYQKRVFPQLSEEERARRESIIRLHLKPAFRGALRSLTLDQTEAYRRQRLEAGVAASTVNKEMTVLKHMVSRAVAWEYVGANPVRPMKKLKDPPGRTRCLEGDEIARLLVACNQVSFKKPTGHFFSELVKGYLKPFVLLALNTGMRRKEILGLTRKDVDWKNHMLTLETTKNGDTRHVHLNAGALTALHALPARLRTERLFPFRKDQVSMAFRRAVSRAEIADFHLHDLRHTFCSYHAMNGVQNRGLMDLMGHKDGRMTSRYSHLSDAYLRAAVNQVVLGLETAKNGTENGTYVAPERSGAL